MTTKTKAEGSLRVAGGKSDKPRESKKAQLIRLLSAKVGADAATISSKLGWQPHTTRSAITGLKKAGYGIAAEKPAPDRPTRYRIAARPRTDAVATAAPEPDDAG